MNNTIKAFLNPHYNFKSKLKHNGEQNQGNSPQILRNLGNEIQNMYSLKINESVQNTCTKISFVKLL